MSIIRALKFYLIPRIWVRIEFDGNWVLDKIETLPDLLCQSEDPADSYKLSFVWMTEYQHSQLPEFTGF